MALFVLSLCPFHISVGVGAFGHRTGSDLLLFNFTSFGIQVFTCPENKENVFALFKCKIIGIDVYTSVYDKRDDLDFLSSLFPLVKW